MSCPRELLPETFYSLFLRKGVYYNRKQAIPMPRRVAEHHRETIQYSTVREMRDEGGDMG